MDESGVLDDIQLEDNKPNWQKAKEGRKSKKEKSDERKQKIDTAYSALFDGVTPVSLSELQEYLDVSTEKTVRNYLKEHGGFDIKNGIVYQKKKE